jgi:hypothetical protein
MVNLFQYKTKTTQTMINSGKYLDSIIQNLTVLRQEINAKSQLGLTDLNKHCEDFVKGILNRIYNYNLDNLNKEKSNFPGLDLGDKALEIAYQITSTKTSEKVDHTLELCLKYEHYKTFKKVIVFILTNKQTSYTIKTVTEPHFKFSDSENIIDFDDIYKDILLLEVDKRKELAEYIEKELPYYWNLLKGDEEKTTAPVLPSVSVASTLTDTALSLAKSRMKHYILWKITFEINSFPKLTTPNLFTALQKNILLRSGNIIVPTILHPTFRKAADSVSIVFEHPLHSTGPINHLVEQHLQLKGSIIDYEFSEYNASDISLINLNHPLSTLMFFLLILSKWHNEKKTTPVIKINIEITSTNPALIHSDYSPFDFGLAFENYKIQNNHYQLTEEITDFTDDNIFDLMQNIYNGFICTAKNVTNPFLTINRTQFDNVINDLRTEFGIK